MKTTTLFLLGALCVVPARAAVCHSDSVRVDAVGGRIRVSVKSGKGWLPVLESAASRGGARINTLEYTSADVTVPMVSISRRLPDDGAVYTHLRPEGNRLHVETTVNLNPNGPTDVEAFDAGWNFLGGKPDATWTPNLTPNPDEVIGRHVFRSPAVVVQRGRLAAVLLPQLDGDLGAVPLPPTLGLDVRDPKGARLDFDLQEHNVVRHVFWRHETGKTTRHSGTREFHYSYDILLTANAEPRRAYRMATRWWDRLMTADNVRAQSVPWARYAATGIDQYMLPVIWRQGVMDGEVVGGATMNSWGYANATWFQCWFNDLRSAYGTYLWGKRLQRPDLVEKARQTRQLLLHSPQKDGLFPVIYDWDSATWHQFTAGGGPDICHVVDCAWAAYWLLMWDQDLETDPASIAFARRFGDYLVANQKPDGNLPAYVTMATMQPTTHLAEGAESAGCGMFLAFLGRVTHEAKYTEAARRVAAYVRRDIIPRNKWFDYETFYSCSGKPETFYDSITDQNPQNNLSIHWAAEMFRQLYLAGHKPADLKEGEALMDYLNLYQQCWSPPWMTFEGYGGYGVQNTDAEWNDARQAQFACTNLDYYALTGKAAYLNRGIAGLRAGFATTYMPENALISPLAYTKKPTGHADENYGHGGVNGPAGPTSWDWGTGSALASVAYARQKYGDVWVDWNTKQAFGIDGVSARLSEDFPQITQPGGTHPKLIIGSGVRTVSPVVVKGKGKPRADVLINGKPVKLNAYQWKNGFTVTPAVGAVVHHLAPVSLTADNAVIRYEVWPLKGAKPRRVVSSVSPGHIGLTAKVTKVADGTFEARWDAASFKPSTQTLTYQFNDDNGRVLGPFRVPVVRFGQETPLWSDDFAGPAALGQVGMDPGPDWTVLKPAPGPTLSVSMGLRLTIPATQAYDLWNNAWDGPRVMRKAPEGDWSYTVTMEVPGIRGDGQAGLAVGLGSGAYAMFGPFQGTSIALEASGRNGMGSIPLPAPGTKIELRARRAGDTLWFDCRPDGGRWSVAVPLRVEAAPGEVGLFAKTWQAIPLSVTFNRAAMAKLD
ncbi:MAG TPA: hypothetical protein VGM51_00395 [Armatimonadota bacterium]|jgi:hypothetical protein